MTDRAAATERKVRIRYTRAVPPNRLNHAGMQARRRRRFKEVGRGGALPGLRNLVILIGKGFNLYV